MLRRSFMKLMGLVPSIVPVHAGLMQQDGSTISPLLSHDLVQCTVFLYGRAVMTGYSIAAANRKEFIKRLDMELKNMRHDFIKHYDSGVAGKTPVTWEDEKPVYINDLLDANDKWRFGGHDGRG